MPPVTTAPLDYRSLLREIIDMWRAHANDKSVRLQAGIDPAIPISI